MDNAGARVRAGEALIVINYRREDSASAALSGGLLGLVMVLVSAAAYV